MKDRTLTTACNYPLSTSNQLSITNFPYIHTL